MEFSNSELAIILQALHVADLYYKDENRKVAGMFHPTADTVRDRLAGINDVIERIIKETETTAS